MTLGANFWANRLAGTGRRRPVAARSRAQRDPVGGAESAGPACADHPWLSESRLIRESLWALVDGARLPSNLRCPRHGRLAHGRSSGTSARGLLALRPKLRSRKLASDDPGGTEAEVFDSVLGRVEVAARATREGGGVVEATTAGHTIAGARHQPLAIAWPYPKLVASIPVPAPLPHVWFTTPSAQGCVQTWAHVLGRGRTEARTTD